ncbi:MAG: LacI family DNA-binding transcriptional regulator [Lapillicoccus sp.]
MSDVARLAGVSITTVSHVFNRTRTVTKTTTALVLEAATEIGYVPDDLLRAERTTSLKTVGLAMSAISNIYFGTVVHSIEQTLSAAGYSLLLADTHDQPSAQMRAVSQLLRKHVEAIILAPVGEPTNILDYAHQHNVPVVLIDRAVDADADQVTADSREPTAQLVDHLAELGHHRIALISGRQGLSTTREREEGYRIGLRRNKRRYRRELQVGGDSSEEGAAAAFTQLLALDTPPTALVVANNSMTIGVLRAAKTMRVRIPEDIALVCFDDFEWADLFHPGLTAIAQPSKAMGAQAGELILSRLAEPSQPSRRVQLRCTFVHRESCGCPLEADVLSA